MIPFSARNFANGDNSKHGSGIFVGKITATSRSDRERVSASDKQIASKDHYALVRTNTIRVKIDDQCEILATVSDPMVDGSGPT